MGGFQNRPPREICNFCRSELHEKKFLDSLWEGFSFFMAQSDGFWGILCSEFFRDLASYAAKVSTYRGGQISSILKT